MAGAMAGHAFSTSCPCSTVHRLRRSEFRKDYEAHSLAWPIRSSRGRYRESARSLSVSAKSKRQDARRAAPAAASAGGFSRRSLMGLIALASPALLLTGGAKSDVPRMNESQQARLEMLQSIEKRAGSKASSFETTGTTTAPSLKQETIALSTSATQESVDTTGSDSPDVKIASPEISPPDLQQVTTPSISLPISAEEKDPVASTSFGETSSQGSGPLGFLNAFGVLGSGVLGALYWLEGRSKTAFKVALAEANTKLETSQASLLAMEKRHETELTDQRSESMKLLTKSEEERAALFDETTQLKSDAKGMLEKKEKAYKATIQTLENKVKSIADKLVQEEQRRQSTEQELRSDLLSARTDLSDAEDKVQNLTKQLIVSKSCFEERGDALHDLEKRLAEGLEKLEETEQTLATTRQQHTELEATIKEQESTEQELRSDLFTARTDLSDAEDRVQNLTKQLIVSKSCFEERGDALHDLEKRLAEALAKLEETEQTLATTRQQHTELEADSKEKIQIVNAALDSRVDELQAANLELDAARAEAKQSGLVIENFQQQVAELERTLAREQESAHKLSKELNSTNQTLRAKTMEATALVEELKCSQRNVECLGKQKQETEANLEAKLKSLRESLQAEQLVTGQMKQELEKTQTSLQASSMEVKSLSDKLKETFLVNRKIQEELGEVRLTADGTVALLNEEKRKVAAAEQQYIETQKALAREESLVQSLRSEFSKAMDAMNDLRKHLNSLSKDLQEANVKVVSLEKDNSELQDALAREKKSSRKLMDKANYVEKELTKMVKEREGSVSKARKLEDELSAAGCEMLKLKNQMLVMGSVIDSAETRMGTIQQVNNEVASLARKFEAILPSSNVEQKQTVNRQMDKLKEQSKAASDITKELKNMKRLFTHFQQNLNEAELDRVEAEAALGNLVDNIGYA